MSEIEQTQSIEGLLPTPSANNPSEPVAGRRSNMLSEPMDSIGAYLNRLDRRALHNFRTEISHGRIALCCIRQR